MTNRKRKGRIREQCDVFQCTRLYRADVAFEQENGTTVFRHMCLKCAETMLAMAAPAARIVQLYPRGGL